MGDEAVRAGMDDPHRIDAARRLLAQAPGEELDRLAVLSARLLGAAHAQVSLFTDRQVVLTPRAPRRPPADALAAQTFAGIPPTATVEGIRAYLGVPIEAAGARVGVLGPNGGGKTTLFRVLLGELEPWRGSLHVRGRLGVVAQTERSRLDLPVSARDVVLLGTIAARPWWRHAGRRDRRNADAALETVGLADRAGVAFGALSGGQRQRVLIARALVQEARVLLLDEPFTGLDTSSAQRLERLIHELAAGGCAVLIATHDIAQTAAWDRVLCLHHRQVAFGAPANVLTADVLESTYGQAVVRLPGGERALAVTDHHHCP
jgi:ABC-type Mn2+/Zn2+ transport system ATPase subunit